MKEKGIKSIIGKMGILLALIVVCVFLAIVTKGQFVTFNNIINILRQTPIVALMAVGMLCVILLGGIDLSAGSMLAFSSCCAGVLMQNFGINTSVGNGSSHITDCGDGGIPGRQILFPRL